MGDAAQVPTEWSGGAAGVAMEGVSVPTESRRRNEILALINMAVLGLNLIGSRLHLIAVSWRSGRSRIVARVAGVQAILRRNMAADQLAGRDGRGNITVRWVKAMQLWMRTAMAAHGLEDKDGQ